MNGFAEHLFDVGAREARDFAKLCALFADHDRTVTLVIDEKRRDDFRGLIRFIPLIDRHGDPVRELVAKKTERLFAHRFRDEEPRALIGVEIGVVIRSVFRQILLRLFEEFFALLALLGRGRNDRGERELLHRLRHEREERFAVLQFVSLI